MYKHTFKRCALLLLAGTALQLFMGDLNASFLAYPWGLILAVNYLYVLVMLYTFSDKWKWVKTLFDRRACISSLSSLLVLTLLFGLIPQDESTGGFIGFLGFSRMTSSWIFNIFLVYFMTVIGLMTVDDIWHWKKRNKFAIAFHLSFFIILVSGIFGNGDKVRVRVATVVGQPVQGGVTSEGKTFTLPFSILLKEFTMDEYPPRLYLWSKDGLSKNFVTIEQQDAKGTLGYWDVNCIELLESAGRKPQETDFVSMNHVGATTATKVKAVHSVSGKSVEGWVSCGSHIFEGTTLQLPDGCEIVMPKREPKRYLSLIEVADQDSKKDFEIEVNSPASIGAWKIYQVGYDNERGRWSTTSVFECIKDAWYPVAQIAMWMILAFGVLMFVFGWKNRKEKEGRK